MFTSKCEELIPLFARHKQVPEAMESAPPLLLVKLALPPDFESLKHVHQLVSDFLIPSTIDAAVYNELHYIMKVYGSLRPVTTGAMDGAAARGRLGLMQKLQANRTEGCSSKAFIGAAANAHFEVLWWLNEFYARMSQPAEMVIAAAENGHSRVVEFLWRGLSSEELEPALVAAASKGHTNVVKLLLLKVTDTRRARSASATNNHTQVLQELLQQDATEQNSDTMLRDLELYATESWTPLTVNDTKC